MSSSPGRVRPSASKLELATIALMIGIVAAATLAIAWALQASGYVPCELCLRERVPYYFGVVAAAVAYGGARARRSDLVLAGFAALIVIFSVGSAIGLYHAGVEWNFWTGPSECSGAFGSPVKASDFFEQLDTVSVVRCDRPALLVFGLSLAAWNAVIAAGLTALALFGIARTAAPTSL